MKEELLRMTANPEAPEEPEAEETEETKETEETEETEDTKPESEEDETFDFHPTSSGFYRVVTVVTAVLGFIAGIVCGSTFKVVEIEYTYYTHLNKEVFNTALMFYVWIGTLIVCLMWGAVTAHFKHQLTVIDNQETIIAMLRNIRDGKTE